MERRLRPGELMAYLNVRERRVETKIAYVGPGGAGKATNLEQLGLRANPRVPAERIVNDDTGELISLDWSATKTAPFRDCSLMVRVVAPRGPLSPERTRALVRDADGIVVVLDARPTAREDNRSCVALVRDALAARASNVPVLVQVNKTDLPEALEAATVARELAADWPHVGAAAARGNGVVETLEQALASVLAELRTAEEDPGTSIDPGGVRTDGNPLLTALRQVLRETVSDHVAELEARFAERIASALEAGLTKFGVGTTDEIARLRMLLTTTNQETTRAMASQSGAMDEIAADVAKLVAETAMRLDHLDSRLDRVKEEIRNDLVRTLDVRSRADREHASSIALTLRRSLESLNGEVKQAGAHERIVEVGEAVVALQGLVEEALALAPAVRELDGAMHRDLRDVVVRRLAAVEELVRSSAAEANESVARAEAAIAELRTQVTELTEELKKREKKGWFG